MNRPCDRCNAGSGWDNQPYDGDTNTVSYCNEVHIGFGIVSWLCLDCRKNLHDIMKNDSLMKSHGLISMKLDFWKSRVHHSTPDTYLDKGLELLSELYSIESLVNDNIEKWLESA